MPPEGSESNARRGATRRRASATAAASLPRERSMHLQYLTRTQIAAVAPQAVAVLPTASLEQHGPHLPIAVDALLCTAVAERAVQRAEEALGPQACFVAPTFSWGNSHHHRPFAGVLSLSSNHYMAAVTDILEGLFQSGFRRLFILNGHGGNTAPNGIIAQDFVHRLGRPVHIAAADYWELGRPALAAADLIASERIPGHAGEFETALMHALHPAMVSGAGMEAIQEQGTDRARYTLPRSHVQSHGAWQAQGGFSDEPQTATGEQGRRIFALIVKAVEQELVALHRLPALI